MFFTLFVIGAAGFLTMVVLSFGHIGGLKSGHHSVGSAGHVAHPVSPGHSPLARVGRASQPLAQARGSRSGWALFHGLMPTPIDVCSYCLGFGAAGMILGPMLSGNLLIIAAVAFALAYNLLLIHPAMNLVLKFVSRESSGLEGMVSTEAEAAGHFDAQGRGIVKLTLDGQVVQLLATLEPSELGRGAAICRGDKLIILEVDAARNRCRVSRDLAS